MAYWFCSVFNVVLYRKRLSSPRCRSELIDSAWVVIVPGQKCIKKLKTNMNSMALRQSPCIIPMNVVKLSPVVFPTLL